MPLSAAAVCPHPPLLVPRLAAGAAGELDDLRAACDAAVARLLAARPRVLVILGSAASGHEYYYPFHASFTGFGVPVSVRLGTGTPRPPAGWVAHDPPAHDPVAHDPVEHGPEEGPAEQGSAAPPLPLSLAIGVWLLARAGSAIDTAPVEDTALVAEAAPVGDMALVAESVAVDAPVAECVALGQRYARRPESVGLLVMGDGTACRGERAPGGADPRAAEYDAMVGKALAEVDTDALLRLDPRLGSQLRVAGRAPWQVLAAAAAASFGGTGAPQGEVYYDAAPYGVNYTVAVWTRPDE